MQKIAKGKRPNFRVSIACWMDLLGYGNMISDAGFNPSHPNAVEAKTRLKDFHRTVADHSRRNFPTLVINDGAVAYRDLSFRSNSNTYEFIQRSFDLHEAIQKAEFGRGHAGPRTVVCVGFRIPGRKRGGSTVSEHVESVFERLDSGEITRRQAKHELSMVRLHSDVIPQLQANFAFTKAYVAEASGTRKGLSGSNFFLDRTVIEGDVPHWMGVTREFAWEHDKLDLKADFLQVSAMNTRTGKPDGLTSVRGGQEVAFALTEDPSIRRAVMKAIKHGSNVAKVD